MSVVYGIDLGTTYTKCALVRPQDAMVQAFKLDVDGKDSPRNTRYALRSAVSVTNEGNGRVAYVGSRSLWQFDEHDPEMDPPYRRFEESKIWIGQDPTRATEGGPPPWPFEPHRWDYRPEDIAALVLRKVKREVEREGGPPMTRVVVTHPQLFTDVRREATRQAVAMADLELVATLTEPDAAAFAYGRESSPGKYMVFDLGGGTLDITIADIGNGRSRVITSDGEREGGRDWDRRIFNRMLQEYADKFGSDGFTEACLDPRTLQDWMLKAETLKWQLNEADTPTTAARRKIICKNELFAGGAMSFQLTKAEFEQVTKPVVDTCLSCATRALGNKGLRWGDLTGILLVGGSTRLNSVRRALADASSLPLNTQIDPDIAVAQGAAIFAHEHLKAPPPQASIAPTSAPTSAARPAAIAVDIEGALARGLGVLAFDPKRGGDIVVAILQKDMRLPARQERSFRTTEANARELVVKLYEGESDDPEVCELIGTCALTGIDPGPAGQPVRVAIDVDLGGKKTITVIAGGQRRAQEIRYDENAVLSPDDLSARIEFIRSIVVW